MKMADKHVTRTWTDQPGLGRPTQMLSSSCPELHQQSTQTKPRYHEQIMKTKSLLLLIGLGAALLSGLHNPKAATQVVSITPSANALNQAATASVVVQF